MDIGYMKKAGNTIPISGLVNNKWYYVPGISEPFPGPGLAIRVIGEVTEKRLAILRRADTILQEEIRAHNLYRKLWQSFAVLLPLKSVGIMGDQRTYEHIIAIRAVT